MTLTLAHALPASGGAFGAALLHPLTGLDHLLAAVAVGLAGAAIGGRLRWALPAAFLAAMLGGLVLAAATALPIFELGVAASVVALGGLALAGRRVEIGSLAVGLTAGFGLLHGHAHGAELGAGAALVLATGLLVVTGALHAAGLWLGQAGRAVTTGAASAVMATGLVLMIL